MLEFLIDQKDVKQMDLARATGRRRSAPYTSRLQLAMLGGPASGFQCGASRGSTRPGVPSIRYSARSLWVDGALEPATWRSVLIAVIYRLGTDKRPLV